MKQGLKQLFCKHEYEENTKYLLGEVIRANICKKCGKIKIKRK